ncbi:MAG: hypothetical protein Q8K78_11900 [Planctomycetaceae bacterium]|nr:hypothetical protein [Planctomycetaceae bacterium]
MIFAHQLSRLPDVEEFRRAFQAMAMLDSILSPDWDFRYCLFNSSWANGEQLGTIRNERGDGVIAHFNSSGCWLRGYANAFSTYPYRSMLSPGGPSYPWLQVLAPAEVVERLREPAFSVGETTFCMWRRNGEDAWQLGSLLRNPPDHPNSDGSEFLLWMLDSRPATYKRWAAETYGQHVNLDDIEYVYRHQPLNSDLVMRLNANLSIEQLATDVSEIGYP